MLNKSGADLRSNGKHLSTEYCHNDVHCMYDVNGLIWVVVARISRKHMVNIGVADRRGQHKVQNP